MSETFQATFYRTRLLWSLGNIACLYWCKNFIHLQVLFPQLLPKLFSLKLFHTENISNHRWTYSNSSQSIFLWTTFEQNFWTLFTFKYSFQEQLSNRCAWKTCSNYLDRIYYYYYSLHCLRYFLKHATFQLLTYWK